MKFLTTLCLLALAVTVQAQITNGVKMSALTGASSVNPTDRTLLLQAGTTLTATVGQIIAPAIAQDNLTTNGLWVQIAAEIANRVANVNYASNNLQVSLYALTANVNANYTSQNTALGNEATARGTSASNLTNYVNAVKSEALANLQATNAALTTAISQLSTGAASTLTNGANASLTGLTVNNLVQPSVDLGVYAVAQNTNILIDFSRGTAQRITINSANSVYTATFVPVNCVDGQSISLMVTGAGGGNRFSQNGAAGFSTVGTAANSILLSNTKVTVLSWQAFGTKLFVSYLAPF